jgi:hypothetical protein
MFGLVVMEGMTLSGHLSNIEKISSNLQIGMFDPAAAAAT